VAPALIARTEVVVNRSQKKVLVIDAGLGNIGSVVAAIRREGSSVIRLPIPPSVPEADSFTHLVLPGVGTFAAGMAGLQKTGWDKWILDYWEPSGRPLLGVCLGMQLLATLGDEGAEESGSLRGLGLIPGSVKPMDSSKDHPLPHIGWNEVTWVSRESHLARDLPDGDFYFVNSYSLRPSSDESCIAYFNYGNRYVAAVGVGTVFGVQFHPEKSQRLGQSLLRNFLSSLKC